MSLTRRHVVLPLDGLSFCSDSISIEFVLIFSHCSPKLCTPESPESLDGGVSPAR